MTLPADAQRQDLVPRRWRSLDDEQRQVAAELVRRAEVLREGSEDGLSIREALDIAARQIGHRRPAGLTGLEPADEPAQGK